MVVDDQVAYDCIRHVLRLLNSSFTAYVRITLNFDDVAFLTLQLRRNLIQCFLGFIVQTDLAAAEVELSVGNLLVLIKVCDCRVQLGGLLIRLLSELLRLASLRTSLLRLLVCLISRCLRLVNSSLGASIDILDIVGVLRSKLIQLVQAVLYRRDLTIHPLLTGEGIQLTPKTFIRLFRQRLPGGVRGGVCCRT